MSWLIFVTGKPGIGKTSVLLRAASRLKAEGYKIGGMISREFRERGVRIGFELVDFSTGRKGWLAHLNQPNGPRVGKYRVNLKNINTIGVESILRAIEDADLIIIDEIGPMELLSSKFKEAVMNGLRSNKPVMGTIHYNAHDHLIDTIKAEENAEILEVTVENRECIHTILVKKVLQYMQRRF